MKNKTNICTHKQKAIQKKVRVESDLDKFEFFLPSHYYSGWRINNLWKQKCILIFAIVIFLNFKYDESMNYKCAYPADSDAHVSLTVSVFVVSWKNFFFYSEFK